MKVTITFQDGSSLGTFAGIDRIDWSSESYRITGLIDGADCQHKKVLFINEKDATTVLVEAEPPTKC